MLCLLSKLFVCTLHPGFANYHAIDPFGPPSNWVVVGELNCTWCFSELPKVTCYASLASKAQKSCVASSIRIDSFRVTAHVQQCNHQSLSTVVERTRASDFPNNHIQNMAWNVYTTNDMSSILRIVLWACECSACCKTAAENVLHVIAPSFALTPHGRCSWTRGDVYGVIAIQVFTSIHFHSCLLSEALQDGSEVIWHVVCHHTWRYQDPFPFQFLQHTPTLTLMLWKSAVKSCSCSSCHETVKKYAKTYTCAH